MTKKKEAVQQETVKQRVVDALDNAELPNLHFNGFVNTMAVGGDFLIVLESNGKPVATLNASYTVVKTFANSLTQLIKNLEKRSGKDIMTVSEIQMYLEDRENEH